MADIVSGLKIDWDDVVEYIDNFTSNFIAANTGATYTIDLSNIKNFNLTLNSDCVFVFPTTVAEDQLTEFNIYLKRDTTPNRTITFPSSVVWVMNIVPSFDGTASTLTMLNFKSLGDEDRWYGRVIGMGWPI